MELEVSTAIGTSCRNCPEGSYEEGRITEHYDLGDVVVVVRNVPASVCETCGDSLTDQGVLERIQAGVDRISRMNSDSESYLWDFEDELPEAEVQLEY